jgi:hypothetical protein
METIFERSPDDMSANEAATLLVKLYADYQHNCGDNDDYATAVGIAIRMLSD